MKEGHLHRCRDGHSWEHPGPAGKCRVPEYASELWGRYTSVEHCPVCTRREDFRDRGEHAHRCPTCKGEWFHEGRCLEAPEMRCPWCAPSEAGTGVGRRRGTHTHQCPRCVRVWEHAEACVAPHRAALPNCPGCEDPARRFAARRGVELPSEAVEEAPEPVRAPVLSAPRRKPGRRLPVASAVVLGGLVLGAVLGVVLSRSPGDRDGGRQPAPPALPKVASAPPAPPATPAPVPSPRPEGSPSTPTGSSPAVSAAPPPAPAVPPPAPRVATPVQPPAAAKPGPVEKPLAAQAARPSPEKPPPRETAPARATAVASAAAKEQPVERCATPSTPSVLVSIESGQVLGPWIGVEVDPGPTPSRCLLVIQRPDDTRWVIDARRVRVRPTD